MTAPELQQRLIERLRNPSVRVALGGALNLGLSAEAEAFVALPEPQAADLLCALHAHQPEALQLLLVSLKQPEWAARAVGAALRAADYAAMVAEFQAWMEDLLRAALPLLDLPLRAAVLHLYPGARPEGWTANVDFPVLGAPEDWPHDRNFPPLDTLEGRQARLRYLGYPVQDPPGISGASTIAALILYQVQQGLPSRGDWDDATLQSLDLDAFCRMSEHREDPSELL